MEYIRLLPHNFCVKLVIRSNPAEQSKRRAEGHHALQHQSGEGRPREHQLGAGATSAGHLWREDLNHVIRLLLPAEHALEKVERHGAKSSSDWPFAQA